MPTHSTLGPSGWTQLKALLWKSWLTQKRRPLWTLAELLVPLILTASLMSVHFLVEKERRSDTVFQPFYVHGDARDFLFQLVDGYPMASPTFTPTELYYAPRTPVTEVIVRKLVNKLNMVPNWAPNNPCSQYLINAAEEWKKGHTLPPLNKFQLSAIAYDNESVLEHVLFEKLKSYSSTFYAGIIFDDDFANAKDIKEITYTLRFPFDQRNLMPDLMQGGTVYTWSTNQFGIFDHQDIHRWPNNSDGGLPGYWREGFLTLQRAMDTVLTETLQPSSLCLMAMTNIKITRFPFPAYVSHPLIEQFALIMPSVMVVSFVLSLLYIARSLTIEKELHLVEYITVVTGLSSWIQWTSHFIMNFIKLTFVSIVMTAMLCTTVLASSHPVLIFAFIFSFCLNVIAFAFFISAFFNRANNATLCSGVVWFLLYVPCLYAQRFYSDLPRLNKICFSFLAHGATVVGCQMMADLESKASGLRWDNVLKRASSNELAPYELLLLLFFDAFPLFLLALYVDAVKSRRKRWYFFIPCVGWCLGRSSSGQTERNAPSTFDSNAVERISTERPSVVIENVVKKYKDHNGQEVLALNHFSLFIQPGELTVILGHNGAGKSTLMKILTGCLHSSSGSVYINDKNVATEMAEIRQILGYCPQYNTLFDCLTVEEHLKFYLQLKNGDAKLSHGRENVDKITRLLMKLRLDKKKHDLARNLSGGQKRRLSLAIALIGGSQVILLDEPTSGMDPGAKGDIIDVLKHIKQPNVTLVLVTHYVDEAEILADRIAIMSDGRLKCYGTNMFLKNRFGNGYRLTISFEPAKRIRTDEAAHRVLEAIDEMCHGACKLLKIKGNEAAFLLYSVPDSTETCRRHQLVLFTLENLAEPLYIRSISVSMPSMQDVFMNCSTNDDKKDKPTIAPVNPNGTDHDDIPHLDLSLTTSRRKKGFRLFVQQFNASFKKRALYSIRQKRVLFFQFAILALSIGMGSALNYLLRRHTPQMPPLELDVGQYGPTVIPLAINLGTNGTNSTVAPDAITMRISERLMNTFTNSVFVNSKVDILPADTDLPTWFLDRTHKEGDPFTKSHLFAIDVGQESYAIEKIGDISLRFFTLGGYFNNRASHSLGAIMNAMGNVAMKHYCAECRIRTINHPLPQTTILYYPFGEEFISVLCLLVGLSFFCTTFAVSIVEERENGAKHLQLLAGLKLSAYWLANCCWDAILYLFACGIVILIWWLGGSLMLTESIGFGHVMLMLIAYGAAILPFTYVLTFLLRTPASAMTVLTSINLLLGLTPTIIVAMLVHLAFGQPDLRDIELQITDISVSIFPQFALARSLMAYYNNLIMREQCKAMDLCSWLARMSNPYFRVTEERLEWQLPGIGRLLLTMLLQSIILFCILFIVEWFSLIPSRWWYSKSRTWALSVSSWFSADPNAVHQLSTGQGGSETDILLDIRNLSIRYDSKSKSDGRPPAVDCLSFRVCKGEIFGFNGENGSGKSSTYKCLTGMLAPYSGEAILAGKDVRNSWRKASKDVGYCPQFDALLERMTGYELLMHFTRIRGLAGSEKNCVVSSLLKILNLTRQADRLVKTYSGGNKRKLSLAIALIGSPPLLLLDEPTCGVDPKARRAIWNMLKFMKHRLGAGIVLTSHDMEECEALCDRMGVLVKGRLACVDTPGSLAEKYGCHYVLRLTVENSSDLDEVEEAVFALLPDAQLKAKPNSCQVHFTVPKSVEVTWSRLYRVVEGIVSQWPLSDFAISRASLQEAFVVIARGEHVPVLDTRPSRVIDI